MLSLNPSESQIKRGFELFRRVCSKCHSLTLFKPAYLKQLGYTTNQALMLTGTHKLTEPLPLTNNIVLKTAKGAMPPDLSLITKQTKHNFVYRLLTGYRPKVLSNKAYFNKTSQSGVTTMPPPFVAGSIKHMFKVPLTVSQYAKDVEAFLLWVSEPWKDIRLRIAFPVIVMFTLLTIPLLWLNPTAGSPC
ncbi:MAG: cytochrome c1 [Candidatus Hodgkinia cicadicola]